MNNRQIIADIAIKRKLYTKEQIEKLESEGKDLPLHTLSGWKKRGYKVKNGEHGIETRLWKKSENERFYLAKAFLFAENQVEEE